MKTLSGITALFLVILMPALLPVICHAESLVRIVDAEGKTESVVELQPDGKANVSVAVSGGEEGQKRSGIPVALHRASDNTFVSATETVDSGVATFFEIEAGTYRVQVDCDQFVFDDISLETISDSQNVASESQTINILDNSNKTRALASLQPGETAQASVSIASSHGEKVSKIRVLLVQLKGDKPSDVFSSAVTNEEGEAHIENIPPGNYLMKVDCDFSLLGYGFEGEDIKSYICPVEPLVK